VTIPSVTDQIDYNISVESLTVLGGELECALNVLHTVSVHVENRSVDTLGNIGRVRA
jgi:hypothetical protein